MPRLARAEFTVLIAASIEVIAALAVVRVLIDSTEPAVTAVVPLVRPVMALAIVVAPAVLASVSLPYSVIAVELETAKPAYVVAIAVAAWAVVVAVISLLKSILRPSEAVNTYTAVVPVWSAVTPVVED